MNRIFSRNLKPLNVQTAYFRLFSTKINHYGMLNCSRASTSKELKDAYYKLSLEWHPDRHMYNKGEAEKKFKEISEAYHVLRDNERRAAYDANVLLEDQILTRKMAESMFEEVHGGGIFQTLELMKRNYKDKSGKKLRGNISFHVPENVQIDGRDMEDLNANRFDDGFGRFGTQSFINRTKHYHEYGLTKKTEELVINDETRTETYENKKGEVIEKTIVTYTYFDGRTRELTEEKVIGKANQPEVKGKKKKKLRTGFTFNGAMENERSQDLGDRKESTARGGNGSYSDIPEAVDIPKFSDLGSHFEIQEAPTFGKKKTTIDHGFDSMTNLPGGEAWREKDFKHKQEVKAQDIVNNFTYVDSKFATMSKPDPLKALQAKQAAEEAAKVNRTTKSITEITDEEFSAMIDRIAAGEQLDIQIGGNEESKDFAPQNVPSPAPRVTYKTEGNTTGFFSDETISGKMEGPSTGDSDEIPTEIRDLQAKLRKGITKKFEYIEPEEDKTSETSVEGLAEIHSKFGMPSASTPFAARSSKFKSGLRGSDKFHAGQFEDEQDISVSDLNKAFRRFGGGKQ